MKRDMDLVRKILLAMEENPDGFFNGIPAIKGYSADQVGYHVYLMLQAGLVEGSDVTPCGRQSPVAIPSCLTWQGHEFLDACRNERVWAKAKEKLKLIGGDAPIEVIKVLLIELTKKQLGM
jgi:hypothetical protein